MVGPGPAASGAQGGGTSGRPAGVLVGVGVGPGDPGLLTVRALARLRAAAAVYAPVMSAGEEGRAESILRAAAPEVAVERLVFSITGDAAAQAAAHRAAAGVVADRLDRGGEVAFITLGDPNVYSTFAHLAAAVTAARPGTAVETEPGIMAFQQLAARSGTVVVDGTEPLVLVSAVDGPEALDAALAQPGAALVIYKGGRHLAAIARRLDAAGRLRHAVWGALLGLPGERVAPLAEVAAAGVDGPYLGSVIVPPARHQGPIHREGS